jgi:GT2 family glycosyltransferase
MPGLVHRAFQGGSALISVVIPTCNRDQELARCLQKLAPGAQTLPSDDYEVIVTDDGDKPAGSTLKHQFPWVRWVSGPCRGPAANRNHGVKHARGEWIAFTDDDCVPDRGWLAAFASTLNTECDVYEGKTTCEAGVQSPLEHAPANITGGYLWSCNFLMRRKRFEQIGGFDEQFRYACMEDVDLRERLKAAGNRIEFVFDAVVDHPPRRALSGARLARHHESWYYFWYKSGTKRLYAPRLVWQIVNQRLRNIYRHKLSVDSIVAFKDFIVELVTVIPRIPIWEIKYRARARRSRVDTGSATDISRLHV